jgi:hypothetical protein
VFVDTLNQNGVNKIDLLFMIDNSLSMADKQTFLQQAVPALLNRLIVPNCVGADGVPNGSIADANGACATGAPEFTPVDDIHVGVVSSSLGGRGKTCTPGTTTNPFDDDRGHLVGSLRNSGAAADGTDITYPTYENLGFLAWDNAGRGANPGGAGLNDRAALAQAFQKMVAAAGEQGCGYESGLEGWYRFLVDPDPPSSIAINPANNQTEAVINPPDLTVLKQRANFLRPDSLVAIIMMSDETDCSIIDYGQGWLVAANDQAIPRPTSQCAANPNDPCCRNCQQGGDAYAKCPAPGAECTVDDQDGNGPGYIGLKNNAPNLRCWQTKRRFGFDLLFGVDRYVNGLTQTTVANRAGAKVPNPLMSYINDPDTGAPVPIYQELLPRNDSSLIYLAGIVGVPWQDLATDDTLDAASPNLTLLTFNQMMTSSPNRWDVVLGQPAASPPVPPSDPFMVESIDPRSGANPVTGQEIVASNSTSPTATINGHEYNVNTNTLDDLQYACIFELPSTMSRDCTAGAFTSSDPTTRRGCDCKTSATDNVVDRNRPLCQPPTGGPAGTQQYFAKAYPGSRYLQVLKSFGEQSTTQNSIVASICPKATSGDLNVSAYGYNSAVNAIINRLKEKLSGACLARGLATTEDPDTGQQVIPCQVIEVTRPNVVLEAVGCATPGRGPVDAALLPAIWQKLKAAGQCDVANRPACSQGNFTVCKIQQVPGDLYQSCLNDVQPDPSVVGYCYIDNMPYIDADGVTQCANPGDPGCIGNPELVKSCDAAHKRILRFVSDPNSPVPAKNSTVILACKGASFNT